jgi:hypothetical protein
VSPVKYELGFYIPEDDILHSHCHGNLRSYNISIVSGNNMAETTNLVAFSHRTPLNLPAFPSASGVGPYTVKKKQQTPFACAPWLCTYVAQ